MSFSFHHVVDLPALTWRFAYEIARASSPLTIWLAVAIGLFWLVRSACSAALQPEPLAGRCAANRDFIGRFSRLWRYGNRLSRGRVLEKCMSETLAVFGWKRDREKAFVYRSAANRFSTRTGTTSSSFITKPIRKNCSAAFPYHLDLYDGSAFVSLVAFTMRGMRPRLGGSLSALFFKPISTHHFLNVRTYVTHEAEAGIYFMQEWLSSRLANVAGPLQLRIAISDSRKWITTAITSMEQRGKIEASAGSFHFYAHSRTE